MMVVLQLFLSFCRIGFTSFGGLSMIPLINSEMLGHQWMSTSEVADIVAIAEMTPGPLGLNCATFAGMRVAGICGALSANLGMLMPTFTICAAGAVFFEKFKRSKRLGYIMTGVRPVCIGLIWAVIFRLSIENYVRDFIPQWNTIFIGILSAVLLIRCKWKIPTVIIISAVLGIVFSLLPI